MIWPPSSYTGQQLQRYRTRLPSAAGPKNSSSRISSPEATARGTCRSANAYGRPSRWNIGKSPAISDSRRPTTNCAYLLLNAISPEPAATMTTDSGCGGRPLGIGPLLRVWGLDDVTAPARPTPRPTPQAREARGTEPDGPGGAVTASSRLQLLAGTWDDGPPLGVLRRCVSLQRGGTR